MIKNKNVDFKLYGTRRASGLTGNVQSQRNKRLWEQELYSLNWRRSSIPRLYSKFPSKRRYFSYRTKKATGFGYL
jgi:hypothetical protein